jgi:uncharacterized membrane-anchored protein YjiN (DUF445 family)
MPDRSVSLDVPVDAADLVRLRRMKVTATGFLAIAAAIYALTFVSASGGSGVLGFVRAASEAAMVGGLADWFAVTALFRRPLRLPIPHTAIIPEKKDEIATKLGTFVTANFLTADLVVRQIEDADVVARVAEWLGEPATADGLGAEVSHAVWVALEELDEDRIFDYVLNLARRDLARRSYAPTLGQLLARAVNGDAQRPLVDTMAARARIYIRENREALRPQLKQWLESKHFVAWLLITDRRTDWLIDRALVELDEIGREPDHPLRRRIDDILRALALDLETNPVTAARVDLAVRGLFEDERFQEPVRRFVTEATESFRSSLKDDEGAFAGQVSRLIQDTAARVATDEELRTSIEGWVQRAVVHAIREYGDEVTVLIRRTVASWDPTTASRRIEVAVGRDLQFIRINGTVVGAIAGVVIHAVTIAS